jgi:hypothetical protein
MSQPQYQIHVQNYNFNKTKLTKSIRPNIYNDVVSANSAAHDLLQNLRSENEVVRVVKIKEEGMKIHATVNVKNQYDVFSWAEVIRIGEGTNGGGRRHSDRSRSGAVNGGVSALVEKKTRLRRSSMRLCLKNHHREREIELRLEERLQVTLHNQEFGYQFFSDNLLPCLNANSAKN